MKKRLSIQKYNYVLMGLFLFWGYSILYAQDSLLCYSVEMKGVASSGHYAPFWLQSNRHGTVSSAPYSGNLMVQIKKSIGVAPTNYNFKKGQPLFDYGFGVTMVGQVDEKAHFLPQEYYATGRLWIFDATIGAKEEIWGNQDPYLSSGGFLFSGNTRPMPRITIGISQYRSFPYTKGYLEIKGGITQAWYWDHEYIKKGLLHHKFAGVRLGGKFPVNISYEFHHVAQWGGISPVYGDLGSSFQSFLHVFLAKSGGSMKNDQLNAEGNHIGSQQLGLDVKGQDWTIHTYWQQVSEDGPIRPIWHTMNIADGLWGISVSQTKWPYLSRIVFEYLNTTDQSGPKHDIDGIVFGGADSYFCNSIYQNGWNYYLRTIGTPFITSPVYNKNNIMYTLNNRTQVFHGGLMGDIKTYKYRFMLSHCRNYGRYDLPLETTNLSTVLEIQHYFPKWWKLNIGIALSADWGTQFGNSYGAMLTVQRSGILCRMVK